MSIYYLDYENGLDANDGSDWANAWKTITLGATAARIAPGDIIRIAKSPAPVSLGINGKWTNNTNTGGGFPTALNITGTADNGSGLIRVTMADTSTLTNNDVVQIVATGGTVEANGAWKITVIDSTHIDLQNSVYINAWTSGGTVQQINSKAIVLDSPLTKNITDFETLFTNAVGGDCTSAKVAVSTDAKEGGNCQRFTLDATPQTNRLEAYLAIPSTDYSSYQKITFWIKNSAAITDANRWAITLCSDNAGVTVVDTFPIPTIPSVGRWIPLTIARNGGGNLGNAIQSIAIRTGSSAPANSSNILLDNLLACTTSGLNLQSLISKSSLEQGGDDYGWYGIQSISPYGTIVLVDNGTATKSNAGRGYIESSETVTTYIRETIKLTMATNASDAMQVINDSGTSGNNIQFQGGYDTGTGLQTGETIVDGLNGSGHCFYLGTKTYITINHMSSVRCNYGISLYTNSVNNLIDQILTQSNHTGSGFSIEAGSTNLIINNIYNANNTDGYGINMSAASYNIRIGEIGNINNNIAAGIAIGSYSHYIGTIKSACNNAIPGVYITGGNTCTIKNIIKANYNATYGISFNQISFDNKIYNISTTGNLTAGVQNTHGVNYIFNSNISEAIKVAGHTSFVNSKLFSSDIISTDGGNIVSEASTLTNGSGQQWKMTTETNTNRQLTYPLTLSLAKIAVTANNQVSVSAWFKKGHATDIGARLVCKGGQIAGVDDDVYVTKADDTSEEELTITFTPTEAGVVEIEAWAYYITGHSTVIVDALTVTQA